MANDNKSAHELASDSDDDTSELERLPATYPDPAALDYEAESDAATHSFENPGHGRKHHSTEALQAALRERDDYIGRLEYDLEQLRARTSGLEIELRAREALTEGVSTELGEARRALLAERERLKEREQAFIELEARLGKAENSLEAAQAELERLRADAVRQENERLKGRLVGFRDEIRRLQEQAARTESYADSVRRRLQDRTAELEAVTNRARRTPAAPGDDEQAQEIDRLEQKAKRLEQDLDRAERKVATQDAAINVLLAELASKTQAGTSEVLADAPPQQRRPERRLPTVDGKPGSEKDRTTRLLVGTIDGQEVRFPLFKNKLTIGRTAHNDIQLKQQFISRRHAVIVCDNDSTRIVDWGSKNGISVNGVRVSEKVLKSGDQLTVGTAEFRFEERPKR